VRPGGYSPIEAFIATFSKLPLGRLPANLTIPQLFPTTRFMRDEQQVDDQCVRLLIERQVPEGGWPFISNGKQMAIEPTALALLALPSNLNHERTAAIRALVHAQNANGSWPAICGDDAHGSGYTGLAAYALGRCREQGMPTSRALHWLLQCRGWESHWLWKWKFRTTDRHVRFDPDKFGWPWTPKTVSGVVPTAYSLLALKCARAISGQKLREFRVRRGTEMLHDRMCPGGGWNAGNGVVYGVALAPHPDATAIALLALRGEPPSDSVTASLDWLERRAQSLHAPWSLAWAILALDAFHLPTHSLLNRLCAVIEPALIGDSGTLAAVCLALRSANGSNVLGEDG
jgi:hypothetical protein